MDGCRSLQRIQAWLTLSIVALATQIVESQPKATLSAFPALLRHIVLLRTQPIALHTQTIVRATPYTIHAYSVAPHLPARLSARREASLE